MSNGYRIQPVLDRHRWEECFNAIEQPHLMQSHAYGEAKKLAQHWHIHRYAFERFGTPVAICQVLEKRLAGLRIASRINRGPLFVDGSPSLEVKENVLRLVRNQWRVFRGGPLLIAPALQMSDENRDMLVRLGFKDRKKYCHCSSLIDLQPDESDMRKRLASNWRNHLKLSEKSGLRLLSSNSAESVEWMLERHADNMRAKNFQGPSRALLKALYQASPADFIVLQAVFDDAPVAGMILARCGRKAEYYIGWFSPAGRKFNCGNFLCWNAALEMKKAGCRWLDLGGYSSNDKFGHFKQGMRGMEYKLIGEWIGL
jgi:lipid II:glycine glycyltransferase (peptidoglycan interpeptide bridge formation enzyme)